MPAKWKIKEVEELAKMLKESPVVAVAGVKGLPSKQMQEIRKKLHGQLEIKVVKNRLARLAFEKVKRDGLKELESHITDPTALIFSKENPFKVYQTFVASRVKAPAKPGQIAPEDIVVPAGDTPFKPGPIIGDLQEVGIKAKIQGPIIAVIADSPVIKAGEEFSPKLANVLAQMEICPMEIGIDIRAALEEGTVYGADILNIDKEQTLTNFATAYQNALNLAVEVGYTTKETVKLMIVKAANNARNLAIDAEIYNGETVDYFLSKADQQAKSLATEASYEPGAAPKKEKPKEEKKEEAPKEEAPKEEKAEEKPAEETKPEEKKEEAPKAEEKPPEETTKEEAPAEVKEEPPKEEPKEEVKEEAKPEEPKEEPKEEPPAEGKKEEKPKEENPLDQIPEAGEEPESDSQTKKE